ncbi:hypothetical protein K2Z84_18615 [Candidatus Binatia bacterium]|nr:hypothetical protein [Candidatus Binatia bacterium]
MNRSAAAFIAALCLTGGCSSHLVFLESSHLGLKASFEPNNPTPAEVDLGYRRGMFAMIPQKSEESGHGQPGSVRVEQSGEGTNKTTTITVTPDPDELMSMYSTFCGNVGFADPVEVHHFLATGVAASNLLANQAALRDLTGSVRENGGACARGTRPAAAPAASPKPVP